MSYHYLVSSLPLLEMGDPAPMTPEEFLFHCTGALEPGDWMELMHVVQGDADACVSSFGRTWFARDTQLRNTVARLRATHLGRDAGEFMHAHDGYDAGIDRAVTEAFAKPTPLDRERTLDRCRWAVLDELVLADPFGLAEVLAFAVRLQLTARWHDMAEDAGRTRVEEIIDANTADGTAEEASQHDATERTLQSVEG